MKKNLYLLKKVSYCPNLIMGSDNVKKIFKSALVVITILFLLCPMCFADDVKFKDQIKKEDGSLFEKIIAECLSPFTADLWNKTMKWYTVFAIISSSLTLIAVFILSYKIMIAGMNTAKKNEAKESLMRLCFRWCCDCFSTIIY